MRNHQPASFSTRAAQTALHRVAVQPSVLRFAACVGTAMVATSAAMRWRHSATIVDTEPITDTEPIDREQGSNTTAAKPVIFALGLASAMAASLRTNPHQREPDTHASQIRESLLSESVSVELDINPEEYDMLKSVLKSTEASSKIDDAKLDPIRRLLKLKQAPPDDAPFRNLIKELEDKTQSDATFVRKFITRLTNPGHGRYDCMTEVSTFRAPPPSPTVLQTFQPPADSKLDFLLWVLKGKWRAPKKDDISYWDPVSLISMLLEGSAVRDLQGARVLRTLGDFSQDRPNPYDPIESIDKIMHTEGGQKYDPMRGFLDGEWHIVTKGMHGTTPRLEVEHTGSDNKRRRLGPFMGLRNNVLSGGKDMNASTGSTKVTRNGRNAANTSSSPSDAKAEAKHLQAEEKEAAVHLDTNKERLNTSVSTAAKANETTRAALKTKIEDFKRTQGSPSDSSHAHGNGSSVSPADTPAADRIQEILSEITSELTEVSHEVRRLYL